MESSLTFTIDNGVGVAAQSADGSLLWTLEPPSPPSWQRHLQEHVEEVEEAEFLDDDDASDYYDDDGDDDDLSIDAESAYDFNTARRILLDDHGRVSMAGLRDSMARQRERAHDGNGGGGVRAADVPAPTVAGLKKRAFHAQAAEGRSATITGCAICLEEFDDGEEVTVMPCSGGHEFHPGCIATWLGKRNTCPLCRHVALPLPTGHNRRRFVVMDDDDDL